MKWWQTQVFLVSLLLRNWGRCKGGAAGHLFDIMAEGGCLFEGGPLLEHGCFFKKKTDLEVLMII